MLTEKRCSGCGKVKPLEDFHRHPNGKGGRTNHCKPCRRESSRLYREQNADRLASKKLAYRIANREREAARARAWGVENRERARQKAKQYYKANADRLKARAREWREANPERKRSNDKRFRAENRARVLAYGQRYRERTKGNPEINAHRAKRTREWRAQFRARIYERDNGLCGLCGDPVDPVGFHIDHIVPVSLGGPNTVENMQLAHPRCNRVKGGRLAQRLTR